MSSSPKSQPTDTPNSRASFTSFSISGRAASDSHCLRLVSHEPFVGREHAIRENRDITSTTHVFERLEARMKIAQTDQGRQIQEQIDDLRALLSAFRNGEIVEDHRN